MEQSPEMTEQLLGWFWADPLRGAAAVACIVALATTPIAFLVLSRTEYLYARRGRTYRKPEFWSVVCGMALVMGVPAIVLALLVKSQYFDESRYAFDPNQTLTVLDQGRQFEDASQAFDAIEAELARVRSARSKLRGSVAAVEAAAGPLRDLAAGSPELAEALEPAVERLDRLNGAVDLDAYDPEAVLAELDAARERLDAEDMTAALVAADDALRVRMKALAEDRKELTEEVKAIDEALLPLRAAAEQSAELDDALSPVLDGLVSIRRGIGLDAPQQLEDLEAPPVEVTRLAAALNRAGYGAAPVFVSSGAAATPAADVAPGPAAAPPGPGLSSSELEAELANVPAPQRDLAGLLPLTDLPEGWEIGRSGDHYLETFNAENLYEKIDGRAESFLQYDVVGMAYTYYHPEGSEANEVQLYIFEMANPLKALGKYGTEKPEEPDPLELGSDGYASGASVFFHAKAYYVQVVPTSESEEFRSFALTIARRISNAILPGSAPDPSADSEPAADRLRRGGDGGAGRRLRRRGRGGRPDHPVRPAARGPRQVERAVRGAGRLRLRLPRRRLPRQLRRGRPELARLHPPLRDPRAGPRHLRPVPGRGRRLRREDHRGRVRRGRRHVRRRELRARRGRLPQGERRRRGQRRRPTSRLPDRSPSRSPRRCRRPRRTSTPPSPPTPRPRPPRAADPVGHPSSNHPRRPLPRGQPPWARS